MAEVPDVRFPHLLPEPSIICIPPRLVSMAMDLTPRFMDVGAVIDRYKMSLDRMAAVLNKTDVDTIFARQAEMLKNIVTNVDMINALEFAFMHMLVLFLNMKKTTWWTRVDPAKPIERDPEKMYDDLKTTAIVPFTATCAQDVRELAFLQENVRLFNVQRGLMAMVIDKKAVEMANEAEEADLVVL